MPRGAKPQPPAPSPAAELWEPEGGQSPSRRYGALLTKYRGLVRKFHEESHERVAVYKLASWAMRNRTSGLAMVQAGAITVVNDRFRLMQRGDPPGAWVPEPADGVRRYPDLRALVVGEALLLERDRGSSGVQRYGWSSSPTGPFVEVYLDRPSGADGTFVLVHDITRAVVEERERTQLRAKLQEHDQLLVLGRLASSIAHDFNNSFFAIRLQLEELIQTAESPGQKQRLKELLELLHGEAGRIRGLQDVTRQRREQPASTVNLGVVIREAARLAQPHLVQGKRKVRLELRLSRAAPVHGYAGELRDAVLNLLINACDAIAGRGRVEVTLRTRGHDVRLEVADTGSGIHPDHLPRIFDPFFTTKAGRGTGQGLATLPGMMARLGGSVVARNRKPRGASFVLTFPRAVPSRAGARAMALPAAPLPKSRLLLVEDDPQVRGALVRALARHRVVAVASGEEAVARVRDRDEFDAVLCDLHLQGIDGWAVADALLERAPGLPVVIISGMGATISAAQPRPDNVREVLTKPVGVEELEVAIAKSLAPARG